MARVLIETQTWGPVEQQMGDNSTRLLVGQTVVIKKTDGTNATVWTAQTGGSGSTSALTTQANGTIPGWIEEGEYDVTTAGVTKRVQATTGLGPLHLGPSNGIDDTEMIQEWWNLCATTPREGYAPAGTWTFTTLTHPATSDGCKIYGAGKRVTTFTQKPSTAQPMVTPAAIGTPSRGIDISHIGWSAVSNPANTGGITLGAVSDSHITDCLVNQPSLFGIRVLGGGVASTGDAMYNTIERNSIFNLRGTGAAHIQLSPAPPTGSTPGSHPDRTRILDNFFNTLWSAASIGVLIDVPPTLAGALSADGVLVLGNNMQGVKYPVDVNTQGSVFFANTAEATGTTTVTDAAITTGTATLTSATANFTTADVDKGIQVTGAGAGGAKLATKILSRTNSTTVVLAANAGTTVSGATAKYGERIEVIIRAGPANFPSNNNALMFNEYATQGVPENFTFTDSGVGTQVLGWNIPSSDPAIPNVGAMLNTVLTDKLGVKGVGGNTILSVLATISSNPARTSFGHFHMTAMPGAPAIATGRDPAIFADQNKAIGLFGVGGANGGVRAWLDKGANAVAGNVLDDGLGNFTNAAGQKIALTKLYDTTLGSNTANFDITSIPAGYGALQIIVRLRTDRAAVNDVVKLTLNADTGANYYYSVDLWAGGAASGSSAIASAQTQVFAGRAPSASAPANVFSAGEIFIPGYDDASNQKSGTGKVGWRDANTGATSVVSGTHHFDWASNSAITRITLAPNTGTNFITGSRVIVYGMP